MISKNTKKELIEVLRKRYRVSMKNEKTKILDDFISLTGFHRKHAVRVLGGNPADQKSKQSFDRHRTRKLKRCRKLLHVHQTAVKSTIVDWKVRYESLTGKPVDLCPFCHKGHLIPIQNLSPLRFPFTRPPPQRKINDNYINTF